MPMVPALRVKYCAKCHHSLSVPAYNSLYPLDDYARAFTTPALMEESAARISNAEASLLAVNAAHTQVQESLKRLQESLEQLQMYHKRLSTYINKQKTYPLPSPIRRLPTEILSLIFSYACWSFGRRDYLTPLSISVTCFKWRSIAISTPALWTNIYVGPVEDIPDGSTKLSLYMYRAKGLPISLQWETFRLDDGKRKGPADPRCDVYRAVLYAEHDKLISDVLRTCKYWRTVELHLEDRDVCHLYDLHLPLLENLRVNEPSLGQFDSSPALTRRAPKLRTLHLSQTGKDLKYWDAECLPWPQIDLLSIDSWSGSMPRTLREYGFVEGNTKTLILKKNMWWTCTHPEHSIHYLTRVVLRLTCFDDTALMDLPTVHLPVLEEFTLEDVDGSLVRPSFPPYFQIIMGVLGLLKNSDCSLRVLKMCKLAEYGFVDVSQGLDSVWRALFLCLEHTTTLQSLSIVESSTNLPLLTAQLISTLRSRNCLPALTSVKLVWGNADSLPVDELVGWLASRGGMEENNLTKLSSVTLGVRHGGNVHPRVLKSMQLLRSRGVQAVMW